MKKFLLSFVLVLLFPGLLFAAAGTVTQTGATVSDNVRTLTFTCTGGTDADAGTIPDTLVSSANLAFVSGWMLTSVEAWPTAGGTAPDAADIFVLMGNAPRIDLLGSEDNGTTAYNGLSLIHATLRRAAVPDMYIPRAGAHQPYFWPITGALTLKVSNQATASANWIIVLTFVR